MQFFDPRAVSVEKHVLVQKVGQNLSAGFSYQALLFQLYPLRSAFLDNVVASSNGYPWLDNAIIRSSYRGDGDNDTL